MAAAVVSYTFVVDPTRFTETGAGVMIPIGPLIVVEARA